MGGCSFTVRASLAVAFTVLWVGVAASWAAEAPAADEAPPVAPPLPEIAKLVLDPPSLTLHHARDGRRSLVWGVTADGRRFDLTDQATWKAGSASVQVDEQGYVTPTAAGKATVTVQAAGRSAELAIDVAGAETPAVRFVRDVMPVLAKTGCNAGTCHGAAQGKNGFKLSLRGYDPEHDYRALISDVSGRRFNRIEPAKSLMLLKPLAEVPHEGKQVIEPGSRHYQLIHDWIAEGTKFEPIGEARATGLTVYPAEIDLDLPGRTQQVIVLATYGDGSVRDVTREAVISSNDENIAKVGGSKVTGIRRGEAAALVRYEGIYATCLITIMGDRTGYAWTDQPANNFVDGLVYAKHQRMKILPSELCTDAEFLRRVYMDLTGRSPSPEQSRTFLTDTTDSAAKRAKLIDDLLASDDFVEYWTNKWADLLQINKKALGDKGVWKFRQWIRDAVASNMPYDQFVRTLLSAQGSSFSNPAVNYYRTLRETDKITEDVSQTFLGIRFNCNKCHDHPFERWTQGQYYEFGAFFAQVAFKKGTLPDEEIVYRNYNGGEVNHPKTNMAVAPRVPYGQTPDYQQTGDRREAFIQWLAGAENPVFAKAMTNRVWSYFFGRGIIEPVDDIRASNPASNPALLDALTEDFVKSGFDMRHLIRTICNSRTYQLSFRTNKWNEDDKVNFSHAIPRRLNAEQLLDTIAVATGKPNRFPGLPVGMRSVEVADGKVPGDDFLALFGRPERQSACECERSNGLSLSHAMNLVNGPTIGNALADKTNRINQLAAAEKDNRKVVEEIYLAVLCRLPTEQELSAIDLGEGEARAELAQDLAWALMNSPAFLFNY